MAVTGIILAGGKSSRMGFDKGTAIYNEKPLIDSVFDALQEVVDEIIVIANNPTYNYLNASVYPDLIKDIGPLGGIYTGLHHSNTDQNIIVACDMPQVNAELFRSLLANAADEQIVIPSVNDRLEPLCAYYNKSIVTDLKIFIDKQQLSLQKVIPTFNPYIMPIDEKDASVFKNVNTVGDLE